MIKPYLKQINDVYFINERIKEINKYYHLFYNIIKNRYEVHDISRGRDSLCLTSKNYPTSKIIEQLIKTNTKNIKTLMNEIEAHNKKIEKNKQSKTFDKANEMFKEIMTFAQSKNQSLSREDIHKIIRN